MPSKQSSKDRKNVIVLCDHYRYNDIFGNNHPLTFDKIIKIFQDIKQKYLEHEFLYRRKINIELGTYGFAVTADRPETDKEYESRMKKAERAALASKVSAERRKEQKLIKEINEFKKLKKILSQKVDIETI